MLNIYTGPGKVYINGIALQPEGVNGPVEAMIDESTGTAGSGTMGFQAETFEDAIVKVTVKPFDNWGSLATLFPSYLGVTTAAGAGALLIGTRPHGATNLAVKIWGPADGRLVNIVRGAITKHPNVMLGPSSPLFGPIEITGIGDLSKNPGDSGFLIANNAITETGAADPGGNFTMADFVRGKWLGAWGTTAGFGGDGGTPMEAKDAWEIQTEATYNVAKCSKVTKHMFLGSVRFLAKVKLVGPTQTQSAGDILSHTSGQRLGSADLVLTGPGGKTVTLKNCRPKGQGFMFGGTELAAGETAFVTDTLYTAGAAQPTLIFSA
jgi:hypothetical protein